MVTFLCFSLSGLEIGNNALCSVTCTSLPLDVVRNNITGVRVVLGVMVCHGGFNFHGEDWQMGFNQVFFCMLLSMLMASSLLHVNNHITI